MQKNQAVTKEWKSKGFNLKCEEVQLLPHKAPGDPERSSRKEAACCRPSAPVNTLELQLEGGGGGGVDGGVSTWLSGRQHPLLDLAGCPPPIPSYCSWY